jgi:hypothetical protein
MNKPTTIGSKIPKGYTQEETDAAEAHTAAGKFQRVIEVFSDSHISSAFLSGIDWQKKQEKENSGVYTLSQKNCEEIANNIVKSLTPKEENSAEDLRTMFDDPRSTEEEEEAARHGLTGER